MISIISGAEGNRKENKKRLSAGTIIPLIILTLYALLLFFPMYWMFVTAFKGPSIAIKIPPELFPAHPTLENFRQLLKNTLILRWTLNTFIVSAAVTAGYVLISSMAGYAFSKKVFPGREVIFWLYISTMMLPYFSFLVPLYLIVSDLTMVNTFAGLILPALAGPFGAFLMRQYMGNLPTELIHAAKIDGSSEFGCFWRIVIPVCKPVVSFLGIITFISQWNNFLWPLIVTNTDKLRLLQVGIALFQLENVKDYGLTMAAASFASVPIIVLFLIFQKHIVKGVTIGALKG